MAVLKKFTKQPGETKFFDVHFEDLLTALATTAVGLPDVVSATGITQTEPATITDGVVRVWATGGTTGVSYVYTIKVTCANGWVEEQEIVVKVKETP